MPMTGSVPERCEEHFLDLIREACRALDDDERVIIDNGDDAFAFTAIPGVALITTDIGIEGIHFTDKLSPEDIGYRIMAANLSDIAAMGGAPRYAFVSLGLPESMNDRYLVALYRGLNEAAAPSNCTIRGGDLSRSRDLVMSITVYGEAFNEPLSRSGAREGDYLYLTGNPGLSRAGLELILEENPEQHRFSEALRAHRRPNERSAMIPEIMDVYGPSAMIDLSDGLSTDLARLARTSKLGCTVDAGKLCRAPELIDYCALKNSDPLDYILSSGEEYELIFTASQLIPEKIIQGVAVRNIGVMTRDSLLIARGTTAVPLESTGYDHFKELP